MQAVQTAAIDCILTTNGNTLPPLKGEGGRKAAGSIRAPGARTQTTMQRVQSGGIVCNFPV